MSRRSRANLGALIMPSNCDALLVTSQRTLPDGSIGIFAGDYQLTQQDLDNVNAWRNKCIADRQRMYDEQAARMAIKTANQPAAPGWAVVGPGDTPSANITADNARNYAASISDPNLKSQVTAVVEKTLAASNQQDGRITIDKPIDAVPIEAGFPSVTGGSETASGASETPLSKYLLAGLALLAFMR